MAEHDHGDGGCRHDTRPGLGRRDLLKGLAAVGAAPALSLAGTRLAFGAAGTGRDVLVVVVLRGGFDGLNAIVPTADPEYQARRPKVGIPQSQLVQLNARFGMHPVMAPLKKFWDAGTFGVVHAVGMAEPTRSHFQAMAELERAAPGSSLRTGWLDRVLGLASGGTLRGVQVGRNFASGGFKGPNPELAMHSVDDFIMAGVHDAADRRQWKKALAGMNADAPSVMARPAASAIAATGQLRGLQTAGYRPRSTAHYPATDLGRSMKDIARLIKADVGLQVASVDYGDWDMHAGMGGVDSGWFHTMLRDLSRSLAAFGTDLGPRLGSVTVITLSEFGRRLKENGSGGTDHGHGQAVLLLGGGVVGGKVHGRWPGLADADLVEGDLAGTTDYRRILAEVLEKRCRISATSTVFPGLTSGRLGVVRART